MSQLDVGAFLDRFGPNAGQSPFERIALAFLGGFQSFLSTYQLNEQTKQEMAFREQEFQMKLQKAQLDQQQQQIDNELAERKFLLDEEKAAETQRSNLATEEHNRLREGRLGRQGDERIAIDAQGNEIDLLQEQGRNARFNLGETGRQFRHQTPSASSQLIQGSIDRRFDRGQDFKLEGRLNQIMSDLGIEPLGFDENNNPIFDEEAERSKAQILDFQRLSPEDREVRLDEIQANRAAEQQQQLQNAIPEMRRQALGATGQSDEVRKRIEFLEKENPGKPLTIQDIFGGGENTETIIGPQGQVPTSFLAPGGQLQPEPDVGFIESLLRGMTQQDLRKRKNRGALEKELERRSRVTGNSGPGVR